MLLKQKIAMCICFFFNAIDYINGFILLNKQSNLLFVDYN